ncbi:MAG: EamA family transporter [Armatimonadetes bacterium]|nr:EamA family transporter [Armatimonadota bacterium]
MSPKFLTIFALVAVYLIWGSTYLAIRIAIETLPPFLMAGTRFLLAGAVLYAWTLARGAERPTANHWKAAAVIGAALLLGGNGLVVWAEQRVPSSLTALLISITPLWMTLMDWARPGGVLPRRAVAAGLLLGFAGVAMLIGPSEMMGEGQVDPIGATALIFATISWAGGSLYSRFAKLPASPLLVTGMEMLAGGALLTLAGLLTMEVQRIEWAQVSMRSVSAYIYLTLIGSLVGFSAYVWLLKNTPLALASSYAYVNPVVAVILGWAVAGEPLTPRTLLAAGVIIMAVVLITTQRSQEPLNEEEVPGAVPEEPGNV